MGQQLNSQLTQHLFLSHTGLILDGWQQAFPAAHFRALHQLSADLPSPTMVWLRLSGESSVAQQVKAARDVYGALPLIAMSDIPSDLEALAVLSVAARGYCNSHAGADVLLKVAAVVAQGGLWIGESIMQRLLNMPAPALEIAPASGMLWGIGLTEREREVARAVAHGASNKEIATQLGITERTVKAHVGAVLEKLKLKNRLQLALLVKDN